MSHCLEVRALVTYCVAGEETTKQPCRWIVHLHSVLFTFFVVVCFTHAIAKTRIYLVRVMPRAAIREHKNREHAEAFLELFPVGAEA